VKILIDPTEMPASLPVMLGGVLSPHQNDAWAWAGSGKNKIKIPVEVIVAEQNTVLDDSLPKGGDED